MSEGNPMHPPVIRTLVVALLAALTFAASAVQADAPTLAGASGTPVSATDSSIDIQIGTFATSEVDQRACTLIITTDNGIGGPGGYRYDLSQGQTSWHGGAGITPGQTYYAYLWSSQSPTCTPCGASCPRSGYEGYSGNTAFTIAAYTPPPPVAPAPPSTTTSTTTTTPASTDPAVTTAATTTTAAAAPVDPLTALELRVQALEDQIAALTSRVDRLEHAGDAASLAFEQALASGDDVATAADIARGTWMNAVYGLGAFK